MSEPAVSGERRAERGVSLVLVALGLVLILALAGLGVDLATLYVARNEAQRSADAAALAGADTFVTSGITIGLTTAGAAQTTAATQATQVGNANLVVGRSPGLDTTNFNASCPAPTSVSGGCFDFSTSNDPRITVQVYENMPTYFMKIFGISTVPVLASATAEAYNPTGPEGPSSTAECLKPWLMPNCDPDHSVVATQSDGYEANTVCPQTKAQAAQGAYPEYFVYPETQPTQLTNQPAIPADDLGQVVNPSLWSSSGSGGAIGEYMNIKAGDPSQAPAPSQFYPVFLPGTNVTFVCPNCAQADKQNSTSDSASRYREFIECCSTAAIVCGDKTINPVSGDKTGPTGQGVDCLIHEGNSGSGQDTISFQNQTDPTIPYTIYSGANNPYTQPSGTVLTTSDSVVTLPLYDGTNLCPGNSCAASVSVSVQGFLQLFLASEGAPQHTVYAYVLNISGCGGTGSQSGSTPVPATTGSAIPVRLIHN
ncbi:MAG TPA: pilus assembly protein TadG-related protein [Patescibacteria group bacterium]|nr:pilus assembly protein TadG-related protein [Patescibacteria group bacterium]